jgi:hypothetical protein
MHNEFDLLRREVEALDEAAIYLRNHNGYLFSRTPLDFLEEIKVRSERITAMANEKIMAIRGGVLDMENMAKFRFPNSDKA